MFFRQIFDRNLAQYAYMIGCQATGEAIVVDPMRDIDQYVSVASDEELRIVAVAETHIHADYLSGAREMAEHLGATVYVSGEGGPVWQSQWVKSGNYKHRILSDGDHFMIGNIRFEVLFTPGHTPEHICYIVTDTTTGTNQPIGMLSGDFLFVGDVGRPDLLETAAGEADVMEPSARTLYDSLQRLKELAPALQVWPGHGAGSACGKALGAVPVSTVGYELAVNASIKAASTPDDFVAFILEGQPEPPLYFARMKVQNRTGPAILNGLPQPKLVRQAKIAELAGATGVAVVDTRPWEQYRAGHLPGALFVPRSRQFNTVAGCYISDGMAIYLIIEERHLRDAVIDLIHVGLDNIVGYATPEMFAEHVASGGEKAVIEEIPAEALDETMDESAFLLDVRRSSELSETGRVPGSSNIAHTRLLDRISEVPKDRRILVQCRTGRRSAYACGLLDRMGYQVTNVAGGFEAWQKSGGKAVPLAK